MEINDVNTHKNDTTTYKSRKNSFGNEIFKKIINIADNSLKNDEYISSKKTRNDTCGEVYSRMNSLDTRDNKVPISKYCENGMVTLTDKYLLFTPYDEEKKGWNKTVIDKGKYDAILNKMENGNPQEIEKEDFWKENLGNETEGSKEQESDTNSNIIVKADGSRVLVITVKIGGMETQMCIEISKPTDFQNSQEYTLERNAPNAPQSVKDAWKKAEQETGMNGHGMDAAKRALERLNNPLQPEGDPNIQALKEKEKLFYDSFINNLKNIG